MLPQSLRFLSCLFALCGPKLVQTCIHASLYLLLRSVFDNSSASALIQTNLWHGSCFLFGSFFVYIADKKCGHPLISFISMIAIFIGILFTFLSVHFIEEEQKKTNNTVLGYFGIYIIAVAFGGAMSSGMIIANNEFSDKMIYKKTITKWIFFGVSICALSSYTVLAYSTQEHYFCNSYVIVLSFYAFMLCIFALSFNHFNKTKKFKGSCNIFQVITELFHCNKEYLNEFNVKDYVSFAGRLTTQNIGYKLSVNCVRNLVPFLFTNLIFSCIYWQQLSLIYAQACQMNISVMNDFDFPIAALCAIPTLFVIVFNDIFVKYFYPLTSRIFGFEWTDLKKQGCGLSVIMLTMIYAACTEMIRRETKVRDESSVCNEEINVSDMSIFWLIPCFLLFGIAELMFVVPSSFFYFSQSPPSMKSVIEAIRSFFNAFGNFFAALLVFTVQKESNNNWIVDDLDEGRLEYVYLILAAIAFLCFVYFVIIASKYEYKAPMEDSRIAKNNYDSVDDKTYLTPTVVSTSKRVMVPAASQTERKRNYEFSYSTTQMAFGSIQ